MNPPRSRVGKVLDFLDRALRDDDKERVEEPEPPKAA